MMAGYNNWCLRLPSSKSVRFCLGVVKSIFRKYFLLALSVLHFPFLPRFFIPP